LNESIAENPETSEDQSDSDDEKETSENESKVPAKISNWRDLVDAHSDVEESTPTIPHPSDLSDEEEETEQRYEPVAGTSIDFSTQSRWTQLPKSKIATNPAYLRKFPMTPYELMSKAELLFSYWRLETSTKEANAKEKDRMERLFKKRIMLEEKFPGHENSSELILDYDLKKNEKIVVDPRVCRQLKLHQVEAVRFLYDNLFGSVNDFPTHLGSGVICAHSMVGLI
jgi:hypothetical protein